MHRFEPFPVFRTKVIRLIGTPWTWAGIVAAWIVADPLKDFAFGDKAMSVALLDISAKIAAMAENPNVRVAMIPVVFFCFWRAASQIIRNDDARTARVVQTTEDSAKRIIEARNSDFEIPLMMAKAAFRGEEIGTLEKAIIDFQVEFERYRNDTARWMGDEIFPVNHTDMPPDPFQYFHGISMWPYYSFAIPEWGGEWQNPPIDRTQDGSGGDFMHRVQHYDGTEPAISASGSGESRPCIKAAYRAQTIRRRTKNKSEPAPTRTAADGSSIGTLNLRRHHCEFRGQYTYSSRLNYSAASIPKCHSGA